MRLSEGPFCRSGEPIAFLYDGERVDSYAGETIAAALAARDVLAFRTTREGQARGPFCGMGVCFDCLVSVNGHDNLRACMQPASDGDRVVPQSYPGAATPARPAAGEPTLLTPELLVIGAGPAGLSAALAGRRAGAEVLLLDERTKGGGQYYKQPNAGLSTRRSDDVDAQYRLGAKLIRAVLDAGVQVLSEAEVWGAFRPLELAATIAGAPMLLRPRMLVVATGAYERGIPLPGWTLPGFMTTGAVQSFLRSHRVAPGRRIVIVGNGPLNLQVGAELVRAGANVVAVVEAAAASAPGRLRHAVSAGLASPALIRQGLRYLATLRRHGVPVLFGSVVTEVQGEGRVQAAIVAPLDAAGLPDRSRARRIETDIVAAGFGFQPNDEIPKLLGAAASLDDATGQPRLTLDSTFQTSVDGLYVVGDALGLGGSQVALAQGSIAGYAAASRLRPPDARAARAVRILRRRLARHLRFQRSLWQMFRAPDLLLALADDDTLVCRCEEVRLGQLRARARDGASAGNMKRATRAGMGRCQGRYCAPVIARLLAEAGAEEIGPLSGLAPRPPIKPVTLADVAAEYAP